MIARPVEGPGLDEVIERVVSDLGEAQQHVGLQLSPATHSPAAPGQSQRRQGACPYLWPAEGLGQPFP
jgi:hypothetical protein